MVMHQIESIHLMHNQILNMLLELSYQPVEKVTTESIVKVQDTFRSHNIDEEKLMEELGFPYISAHILAHTIASKNFIRLMQLPTKYQITDLIADLNIHVNTYDKQFFKFCEAIKQEHR